MLTRLRTNTALLICLIMVAKLLFVNISVVSAANAFEVQELLSKHNAALSKHIHGLTEVSARPDIKDEGLEFCEEDFDNEEESLKKASTPAVLHVLYSFFNRTNTFSGPKLVVLPSAPDLHPKRYIEISVLRI